MPTKFRTICTSGFRDASEPRACRACFVGVWRVVALSKGTSLGHREIGSCGLVKLGVVGAGVESGTPTKFVADRRLFGG